LGRGKGGVAVHTSSSLAIDGGEGHESAAQDEKIGKGKGQALPVYVEHVCGEKRYRIASE
jgi:hypothetical protein